MFTEGFVYISQSLTTNDQEPAPKQAGRSPLCGILTYDLIPETLIHQQNSSVLQLRPVWFEVLMQVRGEKKKGERQGEGGEGEGKEEEKGKGKKERVVCMI